VVAQQATAVPRKRFERIFNNAPPTFGPQVSPVSLGHSQISEPIVLNGSDADGDAVSYAVPGSASGSGMGSAGGALTITGGTARYTPPDTWVGTASYDDVFTVTVTDADSGWHVHGLAGLLNLLTFGLLGSAGHSATGALTVRVSPIASPEPPVTGTGPEPPAPVPVPVPEPEPPVTGPSPEPPAPMPEPEPPVAPPEVPGSFPVSLVNNTGGAYSDDQIFVTIFGQTTPGHWAWVDADGETHQLDHTAAEAPGHLVTGGTNYANMSFSVADASDLRVPPRLDGARIYFSLGQPLYIGISPDDSGWAGPDPMNPTDPNIGTVYDWYEMTYEYGRIPFGGNTTQVDMFGIPFTFTLTQDVSGFSSTRGITLTSDEVFQRFEETMPDAFQSLIVKDGDGEPLRLLAPRSYLPVALATWFDQPVDEFWTKYAGEQFVYNGPGFTVNGGVAANGRFSYTVTSAAGVSTSHTMIKPTTAQVFRADGPFAGTALQGAFLADLDAAFQRGVAATPQDWDNTSAYYPVGGRWNNWAQFFHANSLGGLSYGFPYDDVNNQSSVLILSNTEPLSRLSIAIGS
jgi:cell division septation protein DedD